MKHRNGKYKKLLALLCLFVVTSGIKAETKQDRLELKHELRIGWGDQLFETLMWHNPTHIVSTMPDTYRQIYHEDYKYIQHLWVEYQNRYNSWFSYGGMIDASGVEWTDVVRNGRGEEINRETEHNFYNIVLMPKIRFTYFHHQYVNLYSGLGIGMDINGGTETDYMGRKTDVGVAMEITLLGISANYKQWFLTADIGGLYALKDTETIFLVSSKMISVGVGVRF